MLEHLPDRHPNISYYQHLMGLVPCYRYRTHNLQSYLQHLNPFVHKGHTTVDPIRLSTSHRKQDDAYRHQTPICHQENDRVLRNKVVRVPSRKVETDAPLSRS